MALHSPLPIANDPPLGWRDAVVPVPFRPIVPATPHVVADLAETARLAHVVQAGREFAHSTNNLLSLPRGVLELLEAHAGVPADMRSLVTAAREALTRATTQAQDFLALAGQADSPVDPPLR